MAQSAVEGRPLEETGRVRVTTPLCRAMLSDAIRAVDIETDNDRKLAAAEGALGTLDFDADALTKFKSVREITRRFVALRANAVAGISVLAHFRDEAKTAPSDEARQNLALFAVALDGALHRQKILADDIGRLVAYLDAHESTGAEEHDRAVFDAVARENDLRYPRIRFDPRDFGPLATVADTLTTTSRKASAELARRAEPILGDESAATDRIEPAFSKC